MKACTHCGESLEEDRSNVCLTCVAPDYERECDNCGATPILPMTGMCGPCTFGEAETADGNW